MENVIYIFQHLFLNIFILRQAYKTFFKNYSLILSTLLALLFLMLSLFVNSRAGKYADEKGLNPVTDIVLSNTRVYNVEDFFVYGMIAFFVFICVRCVRYPGQTPYIIKSIAVFVLVRSIFVSLTHLGPFPTHVMIDNDSLGRFIGKFNF